MSHLPLFERVISSRHVYQPSLCNEAVRPLQYREWESPAMVQAMAAVEQGESIRQASGMFGVPRSTLHDRLTGKVTHGKKSGPSPYLSYAEEEELAMFLKKCAEIGYPHTKAEVFALVQQIIDNKCLGKTVSDVYVSFLLCRLC